MNILYVVGRLYPFLAVALVLPLGQMGIHFRRRRDPTQHIYWTLSGILLVSAVLWFVFRGDQNSDLWLDMFFK